MDKSAIEPQKNSLQQLLSQREIGTAQYSQRCFERFSHYRDPKLFSWQRSQVFLSSIKNFTAHDIRRCRLVFASRLRHPLVVRDTRDRPDDVFFANATSLVLSPDRQQILVGSQTGCLGLVPVFFLSFFPADHSAKDKSYQRSCLLSRLECY